ncbi:E3 ISG15--protein ligase Herc6 [Phytophthora ramorum]|uniref:E3 ISG15--protein ligase Herc6 n=1 Tax=Phytophthora ramorum TaxID=164328 RepID=UPI0030AEC676|nr:E3 ISG15--protein ligase Herc6 [Phytophthora ramorum]
MGGRFSRVQYREQDAAVLSHLVLLTQVWGLDEIAFLSMRLRRLSFNFCLTFQQFEDLVGLRSNPLFKTMLHRWFATFQNTHSSSIVNGLEFLTALALSTADGKLDEKAGAVFDIFDFDDSGAITRDELGILIKSAVRGLSKATKGLGPRLAALCPMREVAELTRQCFVHCDLDDEQDLPRARFILWVKQTPKIVNLLRCFVQREYLSEDEAALVLQRCTRGMLARREAAELRLDLQLKVEQELSQAAQKIQDVVVTRKKKRERLRQQKVEQFAHHGAVYSFGANARAHLCHAHMELTRHVTSPLLAAFFKNNELRISRVALSETHASAVASDGQVFTWGAGVPGSFGFLLPPSSQDGSSFSGGGGVIRRQPTRVDDLNDVVIVDSRLGSHHSVALSAGGLVYTWGSGGYGQLGHGDFATADESSERSDAIFRSQFDPHNGREYPVIDLPMQLDSSYFEEMKVTQIACGYYFTLVVTEDGSVFSWGEGSDGQLGLGFADAFRVGFLDPNISGSNFVYIPSPTRIDALKEPIDSVAVGGNHVFATGRAPTRHVFEWGAWKRRGASDARESAFTPLENAALSALNVHHIAAGKEHALAVASRVQVSLTIDQFPYRRRPSGANDDEKDAEDKSLRAIALCARFGSQPAQLSRAITGSVFAVPLPTADFGSSFQTNSSVSAASPAAAAALSAAVYNRSDAHLRSSLARCTGKIALLDRGTSTGHWVSLLVDSTCPPELLEIPCVPAAFGPPLSATGVRAQLFYSPERLSSLRLYVRPDEVVGRIAVLEFGQEDVAFDADALEASELIGRLMHSLVALVKDAQDAGAVGVVVIFDFLEADAFSLEVDDEDCDSAAFTIPAVMIRKSQHGELLLEQLQTPGRRPWSILSHKEDVLGKQILTAQKAGAKAVMVAQTRVDPDPARLGMSVFSAGDDEKAPSSSGVKIPVISIPYGVGARMKANLEGVEAEDSQCRIALAGAGTLYAWGLAENGRLGLGDIENESLFQSGYDGARQKSYQFVQDPEVISTLLFKEITHISCGEEHSAAVSSDGTLYCWGSGRYGKLGTGSLEDEDTPVAIDALGSVKVARVECGVNQTLVATQNPSL